MSTTSSSPSAETPAVSAEAKDALAVLCRALLPVWHSHISSSRRQSEDAVQEMLSAFRDLQPALQPERAPVDAARAVAVQASVEQMFRGLQFQDRISQMLLLLQQDIQRLIEVLENPHAAAADFDVQQWTARLEAGYAMAEQRQVHPKTASRSADDGTTFF